MGAEETDTEVPISEVAPRPDPGRQYVGRAGGVLQVCDDGGGSRATTTEAGGGVDDARTGFGDANGDGAGLAMGAELGAELAVLFCFVLFGLQLSVCLWWLQVPLRDLSDA